jgi:hypothetical protein
MHYLYGAFVGTTKNECEMCESLKTEKCQIEIQPYIKCNCSASAILYCGRNKGHSEIQSDKGTKVKLSL